MRYAIIIDKGDNNYGAYVPDIPGCITTGNSVDEVKRNMAEAIQLHLHGMLRDHEANPQPGSLADFVEVPDEPERWGDGVTVLVAGE